MHHFRHPAVFTFALVLVTLLVFAGLAPHASADGSLPDSDYPELFSWPGTPEAIGLPRFIGTEATPNPLPPIFIPPNDFLAEQGRNSLHGDNFNSDTLNYDAPLGIDPVVSSRQLGLLAATCPTVVFDLHGNVVTICIGVARVRLFLMDPDSLEVLAEQELPLRAWVAAGRPEDITTDSSGGGYFHADQFGRALVGVANQRIQRWEAIQVKKKSWEWQLVDDYDLTAVLNNPHAPLQDAIPDYTGRLWFTTQPGIIGYLDENTGEFETLELGEFLQNGFAIDTDGAIYAVTVEALYRLSVNADGSIVIDWQTEYLNDGGQGGLLSAGSGTTPTLFGDENDLIAIADNSAGRINLNVYRRQDGEQICEFPMFEEGASATENSPIGYGNDVVLENNAGYPGPFGNPQETVAGLTRLHVRQDQSGCDLVWHTEEFRAQTTPRLSTANGLIYTYSVKAGEPFLGIIPTNGWYFGALDWETGKRVYEVWVGNGSFWNNVLDPVTIGPDGTAYVGTKNGLMAIRDGGRSNPGKGPKK
jgi:outer membrane protein assembly factor BamB